MENQLMNLTFILLLLTVIANLIRLWKPEEVWNRLSLIIMWLALLSFLAVLTVRTVAAGRLPFANMYEFVLLCSCAILLLSLFIRKAVMSPLFDLMAGVLVILLLSVSSILPSELRPLMPALQSKWLYAHVATAVIAYGFFGLAFCLGISYLAKSRDDAANLVTLDERIYRMVIMGFTFLTVVIITGAVWAEEVWGTWWSWDPKETWALVTWFIYAAYLHARRTYEWKGPKSAWMVVIGFIVVLFTLFGVSILLPGLHSYM